MTKLQNQGLSIVEILVVLSLTAVIAMISMPKFFVFSNTSTVNTLGKTTQFMQQIAMSMQNQQSATGQATTDFSQTSLQSILESYGTYFKETQVTPQIQYFLYLDGTRLTMTPSLFVPNGISMPPLADYMNSGLTNQWSNQWPLPSSSVTYCGEFNQNECFYLDYNGNSPPNKVGKMGDIIPFRVDPVSGQIQTLYQWEQNQHPNDPPAILCKFVSVYDAQNSVTGASSCP